MEIEVDHDSCQGSGYCAQVAPDLFAMRDGVAHVLVASPVTTEQEDAAAEAETLCPAAAIRL